MPEIVGGYRINLMLLKLYWNERLELVKPSKMNLNGFFIFLMHLTVMGLVFARERNLKEREPRLVTLDGCSQIHLGIPKFA